MSEQPIARTRFGLVRGFTHNGIEKFFGLPYCLPPTGSRRFEPPAPLTAWEGVLEATHHSPMCPQGPSDLEAVMGELHRPYGEDSLTLTINTPSTEGHYPVAVWFHGGANISGAGNLDWYDGEELARRGNLVVVGVNFRLAALGFLYHPAVNTENLSILDQIEALRWIQENIVAFGGDPKRVTVFGQSAGGNAIVHMMGLKETEGLFQAAILESPSIGRANHTRADAMRIAECLFKHLGLDPKDPELKAKIQAKGVDEILKATDECFAEMGREFGGMLFKPVKEEWRTPEATAKAAAQEAVRRWSARVPVVVVTNGIGSVQRGRMERSPIRAYIRGLIISEEVGAAKPDPRMIEAALRAVGCTDRSRALMLGDSLTSDIAGAGAAGVDSCWFNPSGAKNGSVHRPTYEIRRYEQLDELLD